MKRRLFSSLAFCSALLVSGCGDPPQLQGVVEDVWGNPIEGVTVQLEGDQAHTETDVKGAFQFAMPKGKKGVKAGKDGYIPQVSSVHIKSGETPSTPHVKLALFPEPKETGFHGVGRKKFTPIIKHGIRTMGNEILAFTGLPDVGKVQLPARGPVRVVFHTKLRKEDLKRLDLQLHKLKHEGKVSLPTVEGPKPTDVNLWVADAPVSFELQNLPSEDDYLIIIDEKAEKGYYAFHTEGVLSSRDVAVLRSIPEDHKVAYPFELK